MTSLTGGMNVFLIGIRNQLVSRDLRARFMSRQEGVTDCGGRL